MNRYTASATHLGISLVIFVLLSYLIVFQWYPDFFFATDGGWQGIRIVALVDLVLGPTLTLVVYKAGKPGLKLDLTLIGLFQAICLVVGVYIVYAERPIAMVYADGYFHSVTADDYRDAGQSIPDFGHLPGTNPKWVTSYLPDDRELEIRRESFRSRIPIYTLSEYYKPFESTDVDQLKDPFPIADIQRVQKEDLEEFLAEHGGKAEDYLFFPFGVRYGLALIALHQDSVSFAGILSMPTSD